MVATHDAIRTRGRGRTRITDFVAPLSTTDCAAGIVTVFVVGSTGR